MKPIQVVTCLFSAAALFFVVLIWKQQDQHGFDKETIINNYLSERQKEAKKFLTDRKKSYPIDSQMAQRFQKRFEDDVPKTGLSFPSSIYIDDEFIKALSNDPDIDGVRVVFAAYDNTGTSPLGKPYTENEVTVILAPTKGRQMISNLYFDYGDPCKAPCKDDNF